MLAQARARPRLLALGLAAAIVVGLFTAAAVRSLRGASSCDLPPPTPQLPAQLRSLGDFDQPYDAAEPRTLEDAAIKAASALHSDLGGQSLVVGAPVEVGAAGPARYDAIVVPLGTNVASGGGAPRSIEALVAFLRDCSGHAWYSDVADLAAAPPAGFPAVSAADAARQLGVADAGALSLVYTDSPFAPRWRAPSGGTVDALPSASLAAPAAPAAP